MLGVIADERIRGNHGIIGNKTNDVLNNSFNSDMSDSDENNNKIKEESNDTDVVGTMAGICKTHLWTMCLYANNDTS